MNAPFCPSQEDLNVLTNVIVRVARLHRMPAADAEDFAQSVQLRFVERRYDILERFKGQSSLSTYLTVVVVRMLLDWRNSEYGKWRPSVRARRLGDQAVRLERLLYRDGCTLDQAIHTLANAPGAPPVDALHRLASQLRPRVSRRSVAHTPASLSAMAFDDPVEAAEHTRSQRLVRTQIVRVLRGLSRADRRLVYLRYARQRSVADLAHALGIDAKRLYRRFDRIRAQLRGQLLAAGVSNPASVPCRK